jgi:ABC-2 type transport system permease protein
MFAEFKHTLRRMRGQIIGWGIGIGLYGLLMVSFYDSISTIEGFEELLAQYPPELMAFFGDMLAITTPKGYIDLYYFSYMTVIIGIFSVSAAASLLVGHEEEGILDILMAQPISRSSLLWGRVLGYIVATILILLIGWLSWVIPSGKVGMDLTLIEFLLPFIPLLAELLLFGMLALLLSMLLPSVRMAGMLTGSLLVANYLLIGLANINDKLEPIIKYSPLEYFQGGDAIDGLDWGWLAGLLGAAVLFALLAWWRFLRRDIRVGGEGGWRLPKLQMGRKGAASA